MAGLLLAAAVAAIALLAVRSMLTSDVESFSVSIPEQTSTDRSRRRVAVTPDASAPGLESGDAASPWDVAGTEDERLELIEKLGARPRAESQAALLAAAREDPAPDVREAALEALQESDTLDALGAFVHGLSDVDDWVREAAAMGIYRFPERQQAMGAIAALCGSEDRELRIRAAELLDEMVDLQLPWDEIDGGPVVFAWAPPDPLGGDR